MIREAHATGAPQWQTWSPQLLDRAQEEGRLILLNITAEWCHACRKMDEQAFRDLRVLRIIREHYLPIRADIDHDPLIGQRYGGKGVPAVVILDGKKAEIIKRHGYLEADWLYWLLTAVANEPTPEAHQ
jgi:hypothetical protein